MGIHKSVNQCCLHVSMGISLINLGDKMRKILLVAIAICFAVSLFSILPAMGQDTKLLTSSELDRLLGPIALYPDPLIAQILPASTYPEQLLEASQLIELKGGSKLIDDQDWDVSVKAIAHYPSVVNKMVNELDWSDAIGEAYINQPEDVMRSIQRLRGRANLLGYLSSNDNQEIVTYGDIIRIIPAQPQYVYVPVYDPQVVYITRRPRYDTTSLFIGFSIGYIIGSWLDRDCDWNQHKVYYHGWQGNSWIQRSRSFVDFDNSIYVNDRYRDYDNRVIDKHSRREEFNKERQSSYDYKTPGRYKNQPGFKMPVQPNTTTRPYDSWMNKRQHTPRKVNGINPINKPTINNDRYNKNDNVKPSIPNYGNRPRVNNDKKDRNSNVVNPRSRPQINNGRNNQGGTIRSSKPDSGNRQNSKNDIKGQSKQDKTNPQGTGRNNRR